MGNEDALSLSTERLLLREAVAADMADLHDVFAGNRDLLRMRRELPVYDLESVTRYWEATTLDPLRHVLLVVDKSNSAVVGLVDFVDQSPADDTPWIGLVMVSRSRQRRGFATEAVGAVSDLVRSRGHGRLRMAVVEEDEAGLAFARAIGFTTYDHAGTNLVDGGGRLALMELLIDPQAG